MIWRIWPYVKENGDENPSIHYNYFIIVKVQNTTLYLKLTQFTRFAYIGIMGTSYEQV
jgi:hypothetical protein